MWETIITIGLQLLGWGIKKKAKDAETNKKFLELAHHIQAKGLISAKMRFEVDDRLTGLDARMDDEIGQKEEK